MDIRAYFLAKAIHLFYCTKEVHDIFGARERRKVSANDEAIETVIRKTN